MLWSSGKYGGISTFWRSKGKRLALPNSRIMIHQPLGGAQGQAVEIEIQAKEILFSRKH